MSASLAASACPISADLRETAPPSPDTLAYSFTLPAGAASSRVARAATRVVLQSHGLEDMTEAAVQVVAELAACACRFTPDAEVYVSLRYREGALRVVLFDGHPRHSHPRLVAACDARRRGRCGCWGVWCGCVVGSGGLGRLGSRGVGRGCGRWCLGGGLGSLQGWRVGGGDAGVGRCHSCSSAQVRARSASAVAPACV